MLLGANRAQSQTRSHAPGQGQGQERRHAPAGARAGGRVASSPLSSADATLYARLLQLGDRRVMDSATIHTIQLGLSASSPAVRAAAARTLAQLAVSPPAAGAPPRRAATLPLLRSLASGPGIVAEYAALGLGLAHDTAAIPLLATIVHDGNRAAAAAAWALGEVGAPARDALHVALTRPAPARQPPTSVTSALLIAASKLRPLDFPAVEPYLQSRDSRLRWAAAYAIARQRAPAGLRAMLRVARPDAAFRSELARELTSATAGDSLRATAFARVMELAADREPHVRISALRSLGTYGADARAALASAMHDPDANVRITAAQSVATAFGADSSAWLSALRADTGYMFRRSLLQSAVGAGFPLSIVSEWQRSTDWRERAAAVAAQSASRDTASARRVAIAAAHDRDGRVRAAAYAVLVTTDSARADQAVQDALRSAATDPDSIARQALPGFRAPPPDSAIPQRPLAWYQDVVRRVVLAALNGNPATARVITSRGSISVALLGDVAPLTVFNFATLATAGFYDGATFHRVVPAFVAQDGDPRGDGNGGPGYTIRDELNLQPYRRGAVGMALSGPDTGGSQYFLTLSAQPHLDGHYPLFGQVTSGLDAMDALVEGDAIQTIRVRW